MNLRDFLRQYSQDPNQAINVEDFSSSLNLILQNNATISQIASFITILKLNKAHNNYELVAACAKILRSYSVQTPLELNNVVDIVGTGGDGFDTFNASTAASLIVAGTNSNLKVCKHGNRSSSSKCGSADLIESLGCKLEFKSTESIQQAQQLCNYTFLFAQAYHPCLKVLSSVRKELGFSSIFNLVGPLLNPTKPKYMILGVTSPEIGRVISKALLSLGIERAFVVNGREGLDEISPCGDTFVWDVNSGVIKEFLLSCKDFGCENTVSIDSIKGGTSEENSQRFLKLLNGQLPRSDPIVQYSCMNAAALLYVSGKCGTLAEGMQISLDSIYSGKALSVLEKYKTCTG